MCHQGLSDLDVRLVMRRGFPNIYLDLARKLL